MKNFLFIALFITQVVRAADIPAPNVDMQLTKVSEHVWYTQGKAGMASDNDGFISNAGVIVTGKGVVIFDALGSPALSAMLLDKVRAITKQPVVKVVASHYHADHIYGLQTFRERYPKAGIIGPQGALEYLDSDAAAARLDERRVSLDPWVNDNTHLIEPDIINDGVMRFRVGDVAFTLNYVGNAHSDGDQTLLVEPDRVLFSGDVIFEGRIPFVGNADTRHWLEPLDDLDTQGLKALIPGHGPYSHKPADTIKLTRKYLRYLRKVMGAAAEDFVPFDEAYAATDWSEFKNLPAFDAGNRINAYNVFLSMVAEP